MKRLLLLLSCFAFAEEPQLYWLSSDTLWVGQRPGKEWILNVQSAKLEPSPFEVFKKDPSGSYSERSFATSPNGSLYLLSDGQEVAVGRLGAAPHLSFPVKISKESGHMAYWLSDQEIVSMEFPTPFEEGRNCRIYHIGQKKWRGRIPCIKGDFARIYAAFGGKKGHYLVHSAGEGHPAIALVQYGPKRNRLIKGPVPDLYAAGEASVQFSRDGGHIYATSFCALGTERPCFIMDPEKDPWNLYSFSIKDGTHTLIGRGLPRRSQVNADLSALAWPKDEKICFGSFVEKGAIDSGYRRFEPKSEQCLGLK
jgi:hypothetical protein